MSEAAAETEATLLEQALEQMRTAATVLPVATRGRTRARLTKTELDALMTALTPIVEDLAAAYEVAAPAEGPMWQGVDQDGKPYENDKKNALIAEWQAANGISPSANLMRTTVGKTPRAGGRERGDIYSFAYPVQGKGMMSLLMAHRRHRAQLDAYLEDGEDQADDEGASEDE